jgi:hypothetical protein
MPVFPKLLDVDETTGRGAVTFQILPDRPPLTAPPVGCRLPGAAQLADQTDRATLFDSFDVKSCPLALARLSSGSYGMTIGPPPASCNGRYAMFRHDHTIRRTGVSYLYRAGTVRAAADQERTNAGLAAARVRAWLGGQRPIPVDDPRVQMAKRMHAHKSIPVSEVCRTLRISRPTLSRYLAMA